MGVNPVVDTHIIDSMFRLGFKMDFHIEKLGATKIVTVDHPPCLILDPNSASRQVDLPAEADSEGLMFFIFNDGDGSQTLVVKDDGGTSSITWIFPIHAGWVHCDGTKWRGIVSDGIT